MRTICDNAPSATMVPGLICVLSDRTFAGPVGFRAIAACRLLILDVHDPFMCARFTILPTLSSFGRIALGALPCARPAFGDSLLTASWDVRRLLKKAVAPRQHHRHCYH